MRRHVCSRSLRDLPLIRAAATLGLVPLMTGCSTGHESAGASAEQVVTTDPCTEASVIEHANVLTERTDNQRTSLNERPGFNASLFAPASGWGLLKSIPVSGLVYSQPLYASAVTMSDGLVHDVLVVVTTNNYVYAFDANTYATLWGGSPKSVGPVPPNSQYFVQSIISTPVIDPTKSTLYVSYKTSEGGTGALHIAKIALSSGATLTDHLVTATHFSAGTGGIGNDGLCSANTELCSDPGAVVQRSALLLANGILYVAIGGAQEGALTKPNGFATYPQYRYRGQILAYDAATLSYAGSFTTVSPGAGMSRMGGGIWQGSVGPSIDCATGDIYFATGNAMSDYTISASFVSDMSPAPGSYANSVVRLHPEISTTSAGTSVSFGVAASFTPYRSYWLSVNDMDLGSSAPLLVPGTNQLVQAGKEGVLYVLDRDAMKSGLSPQTAAEYDAYAASHTEQLLGVIPISDGGTAPQDPLVLGTYVAYQPSDPSRDGLTANDEFEVATNYDIPAPPMDSWMMWPHVHGTPSAATFSNGDEYMYVWPEKDFLKAYKVTSVSPLEFETLPATNGSVAPSPSGMPGGLLSIAVDTSGSASPASGIIIASVPIQSRAQSAVPGSLHAYNAIPNGNRIEELWNDESDPLSGGYYFSRHAVPTIGSNNRVYLGTNSGLVLVYGAGADTRPKVSTPTSPITAFHQDDANKQITAATVGSDGAVHVFWEMNNGPWSAQQEASVTPTGIAAPGTGIVSVEESDLRTFDTFFVDKYGEIEWLSVVDGQAWVDHGAISQAGYPAQTLTATLRGPNAVDVIAVASDGSATVFSKTAPATSFTATQLSAANTYLASASFAPVVMIGGQEIALLSVGAGGQLYASTSFAILPALWSGWSTPTPLTTSPAVPFPASARWAFYGAYAAAIDAAGILHVVWYNGGAWVTAALSNFGGAPVGGAVAMAPVNGSSSPSVFTVGGEGSLDVYSLTSQGWPNWTPVYAAHTVSFGAALPGSPVAVALQSATAGAQVLDVLVPGNTDILLSYLGGNAPFWTRPGPVFH